MNLKKEMILFPRRIEKHLSVFLIWLCTKFNWIQCKDDNFAINFCFNFNQTADRKCFLSLQRNNMLLVNLLPSWWDQLSTLVITQELGNPNYWSRL